MFLIAIILNYPYAMHTIAEYILKNFYVDNLLKSTGTTDEAKEFNFDRYVQSWWL